MENKTFTKTFKGQYKPLNYYFPIDVEVEVEFQNIGSQEELNQLILDGECYEYKVKSIWGWNDNSEWESFLHEFSGDFIGCSQTEQIDGIISDNIDKEAKAYEQARKNG